MKSVLYSKLSVALLAAAAISFQVEVAAALPFNQDMAFGQNLQTGKMMRPKADESVPMGSVRTYVRTPDEALKLVNPIPRTKVSIEKGKRLFEINCKSCHGAFKKDDQGIYQHQDGPAYDYLKTGGLIPPNLQLSQAPDGYFFQMIHFGRQIPIPNAPEMIRMPAYGWKLSIKEHWDIVNYIRSVQENSSAAQKPAGTNK